MTIYKKYADEVNTRVANIEKIRAQINADVEKYSSERAAAQREQSEAVRVGDIDKYNAAVEAERKAAEMEVFAARRQDSLHVEDLIGESELKRVEGELLPIITKSSDATTRKLIKLCENIVSVIDEFNAEHEEYENALLDWAKASGAYIYSAPEAPSYENFIKGLYEYMTKPSTNDGETTISRGKKSME